MLAEQTGRLQFQYSLWSFPLFRCERSAFSCHGEASPVLERLTIYKLALNPRFLGITSEYWVVVCRVCSVWILEITCRWFGFVIQQEVLKTFPGLSRICERSRLADSNFHIHYDLFPFFDVRGLLSLVMVRLLPCLICWPFTSRRWTHVFLGLLVDIELWSVLSVQCESWKSLVWFGFVLQQEVLKTFPGLSRIC